MFNLMPKHAKFIFPSCGVSFEFASDATWDSGASKMKNGYVELNIETWLMKPSVEMLQKIKNSLFRTLRPLYRDEIVIVEVPSVKTQGRFSFIRLKICSNEKCPVKNQILKNFKEIIFREI